MDIFIDTFSYGIYTIVKTVDRKSELGECDMCPFVTN